MYKLLTISLVTFLTFSRASVLQPRDLVDEATKQLEQLKSIVEGDILAAHNELNDLLSEIKSHIYYVTVGVDISLSQHHYGTVKSALTALVNLANGAGYDVTPCTDTREEVLDSLPNRCRQQIDSCMRALDREATKVAEDARYVVDIHMNKVHDLENQLRRCREDILCISPVISEIELDKIRMPQKIKTEVLITENFFSSLTVSVQTCADSNVAKYTADSSTILKEIEACINSIMG